MKKIIILITTLFTVFISNAQTVRGYSMKQPPNGPTINPSSSMTTFTATAGTPSASQNFTFIGTGLTGSVTWTPDAPMEVSSDNTTFTTSVTYTQTGGSASGTVYVRVKGSATNGSFSGNIVGTNTGATSVNVPFSATVGGNPSMSVSPNIITNLNSASGTAGAAQTFNVTFANLTGNVTVTSFSPVEISQNGGSTWSSTTQVFSTGSPKTISARAAASASAGSYSGNIVVSATGVTTQNVATSGTVSASSTAAGWNFSQTSQVVSGWNNLAGNPNSGLTSTDGLTGWILSTVPGTWDVFAGSVYASNADGGSTSGGTYGAEFPSTVVAGTFVNIVKYSANAYGLQFSNLAAGTYQLDLIGSIKSGVITSGTVEYHALFGSGSDVQKTLNVQDNTQNIVTWSGTITAGQTIKFGIFQPAAGTPAFGVGNAVRLIKTN